VIVNRVCHAAGRNNFAAQEQAAKQYLEPDELREAQVR